MAAIPTLPTIAWGTLRHGIEPELYALAGIVYLLVFALLFVIFLPIRQGVLRLGVPGQRGAGGLGVSRRTRVRADRAPRRRGRATCRPVADPRAPLRSDRVWR